MRAGLWDIVDTTNRANATFNVRCAQINKCVRWIPLRVVPAISANNSAAKVSHRFQNFPLLFVNSFFLVKLPSGFRPLFDYLCTEDVEVSIDQLGNPRSSER